MFLLNGESRHCVDVSDRGFQYGDGVFETIEVVNGKPLFFDRHLIRLASGCQALMIPCPDFSILENEARQLSTGAEHAVLKLIVTRGSGGRGYRVPQQVLPTRLLSLHPYPDYPKDFQAAGINARVCERRLAINPELARIKHLNRLEQILARAEWQDDEFQEGLMMDRDNRFVEGTMSNLFWVKNDVLHTPLLNNCGIAGIVRELIIELARAARLSVVEESIDIAGLLQVDELFVTNSVIGIWPVTRLEYRAFAVGGITRQMQKLYAQARAVEAQA